jgi:hypothetical protein
MYRRNRTLIVGKIISQVPPPHLINVMTIVLIRTKQRVSQDKKQDSIKNEGGGPNFEWIVRSTAGDGSRN